VSKDLVRNSKIRKRPEEPTSEESTEIAQATRALAERMLFGTESRPQPVQDQPRIILALDCTSSMGEFIASRKITAKVAADMAHALFAKAGPAGLEVQLAYFRGDGDDQSSKQPRQFRVSTKWYTTPGELARAIAAVEHWPGWTQHCRLLRHVIAEAEQHAVQELVIVSDAFEKWTPRRPHGDDLRAALVHAERLRDLGVKITGAYKGTIRGGCPLDRAGVNAEQAFREIAAANDGACFLFDPGTLAERFGEIAERAALAAKGDAAGTQALLQHFQAIPFEIEMNVVGEQVVECTAHGDDGRAERKGDNDD
jgi:hypothetical protein